MNARILRTLLGGATLAASGAYTFVYLYRWEWNRALTSRMQHRRVTPEVLKQACFMKDTGERDIREEAFPFIFRIRFHRIWFPMVKKGH